MKAEEIANLLLNNGVAVAVILYFMYRDFRFFDTLQTTLQTLVDTVNTLEDTINTFHPAQPVTNKKGVKKK